jgi:hypothetical protein
VQKKARELLDRAIEPALYQLRDIMLKPGTSDSDRLRAVQMVLDRSGFGAGTKVEHEIKPWEITLQHAFKENPPVINRAVPQDMLDNVNSYAQPTIEDIEDAEVVEDEVDPRDLLPRIIPARSAHERATVRGAAEPPRRKR